MKLKKRKWLSLLLCFALILSLMPTTALAADVFSGGDGTAASPYEISDLATLEAFRDYINAGNGAGEYFKLTDNIDMSEKYGADIGGSEVSWTPIGNFDNQFKGNFDGGGYTISGLYINSTSDAQGLFGYVGSGGTVQNLGVDGTVSGNYNVGGVVGWNYGAVTNCYNTGTVSGTADVSGVVGNNYGTITNCYNTGMVSGTADVSGVVGNNYGTITNCYNTGMVSGDYYVSGGDYVGGVVGWNKGTVTNCCNTGTVSGGDAAGGVVGANLGVVTNCYNTGDVSGGDVVGGVVGFNENRGTVTNCYNIDTVSGNNYIGGVVGYNYGTVTNCYNTGAVRGDLVGGGVVGTNYSTVTNCYSTGDVRGGMAGGGVVGTNEGGTVTNCYYLIGTADVGIGAGYGIAEVKTAAEFATQSTFVDWDFDDTWSMDNILGRPILAAIPETGYFSGEGTAESPYLIPDLATLEMFRNYINAGNGEGEYFKLTDDIEMSEKYGADIGGSEVSWTPIGNYDNQFNGNFDGGGHTISGLYINSASYYQGLFGCVGSGGTVQNLGVDGTVSGDYYVGGVVGENDGTVTNCYNAGTVKDIYDAPADFSSGDFIGGVVGSNDGTVTNCYNTGDVSSNRYAGGVVGYNSYGTVTNCYNTGDVSSNHYAGGVVGYNSYGTVTNCCNTGTVSGDYSIGGVVGMNYDTVTNCYNTGAVSGESAVGGVAGYNENTVTNCYYLTGTADGGIDGSDTIGSAEAKTAEQFASGEVARLLQGEQTEQVWGQTLSEDKFPVLTDAAAKAVYKVTFATQTNESYAVKYANPTGVSSMPDAPTGEVGFTFEKWTLGGAEFTANTPVTEDITVTAQWLNHPAYTVTIPTQVSIGGTAEIKAENVNIAEGYLLNVTLSESDFILKTAEGAELKYTVTKDEKAVNVDDTVLTVAGGTADDSGTVKLAFNLADGETVTYAGAYTGTVIFKVSVEEDVLTQDKNGVYLIRTAYNLAAFRDLVNSGQTDINAMLMNDIDLKGSETKQWTPIGNSVNQFIGTFDGGGYTISGLYINAPDSDRQGLFGTVGDSGTVQNLGVDGTVSGNVEVGGVVGENKLGTVTNCYNTGDVSGEAVGGVVGRNDSGTVTNCYNTGDVIGSRYAGGVVGINTDTVTNCYNTGTVSGDRYVGGVAGWDTGTVTNCYYLNTCGAGGVGTNLTAEQFTQQDSFTDWDFEAIWQMSDTLKRPTLRSNPENAS